ncbi:MAG: hypothetical protein OEZ32_13295 [Nitrospinota bacterium]|nr:hypothetical protein [Nitrospinota bacterium]
MADYFSTWTGFSAVATGKQQDLTPFDDETLLPHSFSNEEQ